MPSELKTNFAFFVKCQHCMKCLLYCGLKIANKKLSYIERQARQTDRQRQEQRDRDRESVCFPHII